MNKLLQLALISTIMITNGFAPGELVEITEGVAITGTTVIVPENLEITNAGTNTGIDDPANSTAIDVFFGGKLIGEGKVSGLLIRHHFADWRAHDDAYCVDSFRGTIGKDLTVTNLQEMYDSGKLQRLYRNVNPNDQIEATKTVFLTQEMSQPIGEEEMALSETKLIANPYAPDILKIDNTTFVIDNSGDTAGNIQANLSIATDNLPEGYTAATGLKLIAGAHSETPVDSKSMTLSGDNCELTGPLEIANGDVFMGARSNGSSTKALGGITALSVKNGATMHLQGTDPVTTTCNWNFYGKSKLIANKKLIVRAGTTVTFGKVKQTGP